MRPPLRIVTGAVLLTALLPVQAAPTETAVPLPSLRELARARGTHLGTHFPNLLCVSNRDHTLKPDWRERNALDFEHTTLRLIADTADATAPGLR